jgi:hypothetical protein
MDCVGLSSLPDGVSWACSRCVNRIRSCHICDSVEKCSSSSSIIACSVPHCGKTFHEVCLKKKYPDWTGDTTSMICPLHRCQTRSCCDPITDESYFCIFCLSAYHLRCMPEPVQIICENVCVCERHPFSLPPLRPGQSHSMDILQRLLTVRIGLEPAGRHMKKQKFSDNALEDSSSGVLTGSTSTPSPTSSPADDEPALNILSMNQSSILPFLASEFAYPFQVQTSVSETHIPINDDTLADVGVDKSSKVDRSGLEYVSLRRNEWTCAKPVFDKDYSTDFFDPSDLCACIGTCGDHCPNRVVFIECDASNCRITRETSKAAKLSATDEIGATTCGNRHYSKPLRQSKRLFKVSEAGGKGMGLVASGPITKGAFLIEYIGEVLQVDDWIDRQKSEPPNSGKHFYTMELVSPDYFVDASRKGNEARLINHSCDPNLETQKWSVRGEPRIGLFALREIAPGEELTFNYQFETHASKPFKCLCGTAKCSGWIGGRQTKKKPEEIDLVKTKKRNTASSSDLLGPLNSLLAVSCPDVRLSSTRTDGTRKKDIEIQQEELALCNAKINYSLHYVWASGGQSGEEWKEDGRKCTSCEPSRIPFNPGPILALSTNKLECQFIRERNILVLRNLNKARRDWARQMYIWSNLPQGIEKIFESNLISDDICVRCRRTGRMVWCEKCVRSFHQCCLGSADSTRAQQLICRRCKRISPNDVPPIRKNAKDRYVQFKARRNGYWNELVLPGLLAAAQKKNPRI